MYEGMFLVDSALAGSEWESVNAAIKGIVEKAGGEIVSLEKWDERRLAYGIDGKSRGTYILSYFKAEPGKIPGIERDVRLNERLMRVLILRADHGVPAAQKASSEDIRLSLVEAPHPNSSSKEPAEQSPSVSERCLPAEPVSEEGS
jgi:small subunit ribosomal protein S6